MASRNKNVPTLRFKGYDDKWIVKSLDDIVNVIDCKHRTPEYVESGVPVVSPGSIKWGEIDLTSPTKRVTEEEYKSLMDHCVPKKGDLVFSRNQSIGVASILFKEEKFVLGQDTVLIQPKKVNSIFNYFRLQTDSVQTQISKLSGGSTFARINLKDIRKLKLAIVDSLAEQQKIASFLAAIDEKIRQLTRKKELLEQYKKGVMQQLFSGKLRFKDENRKAYPKWEEKKIDDVAEIVGGGTPDTLIAEYWDGDIQWYTPTEISERFASKSKRMISKIGLENSSAKLLPAGTILFTSRATVAEVSFAREECTTNQGFQSLIVNSSNDSEFIFYWIKNNKHALLKKSQGSTFLEISKNQMIKIKILLPYIHEQRRIGSFISAIDTKIESVDAQINQTQLFKKGLLQQMFV